jgi:hypothetical protein
MKVFLLASHNASGKVSLLQIESGTVDFSPTPAAARNIIASQYSVLDTLLVHFNNDSIDETPQISQILSKGSYRRVSEQLLQGNHITPCGDGVAPGQGLRPGLTPFDVLGSIAGNFLFNDRENACEAVVQWLDRF